MGEGSTGRVRALVCFSHLRWDFVWQRPQHLLSRFARHVPVLVIEEPIFVETDGDGDLQLVERGNVAVVTPRLPIALESHWGFNAVTNPRIATLLGPLFTARGLSTGNPGVIAWYYTPMALGVAPAAFTPSLTVFDAMDELASFAGAPPELRAQEAAVMAAADLVFAGGPSLYQARQHRHPRVTCFPSGVEPGHFARATRDQPAPPELSGRDHPLLGFYGVIDERLDLDLVAALADARPAWTLALIGPVVKIDEADLPRRPNIVYAGKQAYEDLPSFLASFDVAILPFALNEATRFISPTKTLEYLAGEKPVVSTPVPDVIDLYSRVVEIAATPDAFIAAVERLLAESPEHQARRRTEAATILDRSTWDAIAGDMWGLMEEAMASTSQATPAVVDPAHAPDAPVGVAGA